MTFNGCVRIAEDQLKGPIRQKETSLSGEKRKNGGGGGGDSQGPKVVFAKNTRWNVGNHNRLSWFKKKFWGRKRGEENQRGGGDLGLFTRDPFKEPW